MINSLHIHEKYIFLNKNIFFSQKVQIQNIFFKIYFNIFIHNLLFCGFKCHICNIFYNISIINDKYIHVGT